MPEDLTGKVFNRYTVVAKAPPRVFSSGQEFPYWECKCLCGRVRIVSENSLKQGKSNSCGCIRTELNRLLPYEALYNYFVRCSEKVHRQVTIDYPWFFEFIRQNPTCHYCNEKLVWLEFRKKGTSLPYNMDRVDNEKGYDKDNIVPCCPRCNKWKGANQYQLFYNQMGPIRAFTKVFYAVRKTDCSPSATARDCIGRSSA